MKRGFRGVPRPLLPAMLLVATNPNAGQEHDAVAQSQPSSSCPLVPSTSSPQVQLHTTIFTFTYTYTTTLSHKTYTSPIPETEPASFEHTYEEPSLIHQHFSPPQEQAQGQPSMDDLLQVVPQLISRIDSLGKRISNKPAEQWGYALVEVVTESGRSWKVLKRRNMVLSDCIERKNLRLRGGKKSDGFSSSQYKELVILSTTRVIASGGENKWKNIRKEIQVRKEAKGNTVSEQLSMASEQVSTVGAKCLLLLLLKAHREGKALMIRKKLLRSQKKNFTKGTMEVISAEEFEFEEVQGRI
ncbi:hypothetical protein Tco_0808568 [Tanacetum coccineum]